MLHGPVFFLSLLVCPDLARMVKFCISIGLEPQSMEYTLMDHPSHRDMMCEAYRQIGTRRTCPSYEY